MSKKYLYLIIALLMVLLIIVMSYFAFFRSDVIQTRNEGKYPESILNAINNPVERISESFINLVVDDRYLISYGGDTNDGTFYITINSEPVDEIAVEAEQVFLEKLLINQDYACELYVIINVPSGIDSNLSNYNFGLSFCPDNKPHIGDVSREPAANERYTEELIIEN